MPDTRAYLQGSSGVHASTGQGYFGSKRGNQHNSSPVLWLLPNLMQMQTDEYLTWLFIKHGSVGHSRAGKEDSLSTSAEHANWPGARRPEGGLEMVRTEVGQPTVLYTLKIFTQWHTKWLIRIRSILRDGPQFRCSRTQRLLPVIKTVSFQSTLYLLYSVQSV